MKARILSFLLVLLVNLTFVDVHAYSHLLGDYDPIESCEHDDFLRTGENFSSFNLPEHTGKIQQKILVHSYDETVEPQCNAGHQFLDFHYTNLPPPQLF
jgi:hypothetical protein